MAKKSVGSAAFRIWSFGFHSSFVIRISSFHSGATLATGSNLTGRFPALTFCPFGGIFLLVKPGTKTLTAFRRRDVKNLVRIKVNGVERQHEVEPRMLLVHFLRDHCKL